MLACHVIGVTLYLCNIIFSTVNGGDDGHVCSQKAGLLVPFFFFLSTTIFFTASRFCSLTVITFVISSFFSFLSIVYFSLHFFRYHTAGLAKSRVKKKKKKSVFFGGGQGVYFFFNVYFLFFIRFNFATKMNLFSHDFISG